MITVSLDSLLEFLQKHQYNAKMQSETSQVYTILKVSNQDFPLFMRIYSESDLLQLLVFFPCELKKHSTADLARLLHMLNKEIDIPGFGMDEIAGAVFYRLMIPIQNKKISEDLLKSLLETIERVCKMFATPIQAVSYGTTTLDEILRKSNELGSQQKFNG